VAKKKRRPAEPPLPAPEERTPEARGWDAITAAVEELYSEQTNPAHFAPPLHPPFTEDGMLYGIGAYRADKPRHWHMVTYGFSELYEKESDDPDVSGWGFELTFRLARGAKEKQPPSWALNFLMNLGRYVRRSRNPFGDGHRMDLNGPIALGTAIAIRAIAFTLDPQLSAIVTPNGRLEFLQVVGITLDELNAATDWTTDGVFDLLRKTNPLLITELSRRSILEDKDTADRVAAGIEQDGSSSDRSYVSVLEWTVSRRRGRSSATVTIGARVVDNLVRKLRSRLLHQRDFWLAGPEKLFGLRPAGAIGWQTDRDALIVEVNEPAVHAMLATLRPVRGTYIWPELPGLTLEIVPSEIRDPDGKLIEVIG
jgi:hypothetical protein